MRSTPPRQFLPYTRENAPTREACLRCAEGDGKPVTPRPEKLLLPPFLPRRRPQKGLFSPLLPRTAPAARPAPGFFPPEHPAVLALFPASAWLFAPASPPNPPWCAPKPGFLPRFPAARPGFCPVFALVAPVLPPASRPAALPRPATAPWDAACRPTRDPPPPPPRYTSPLRRGEVCEGPGGPRTLAVSTGDRRPLSRKIPRNWGPGVFSPGTQKSRPVEGGKEDL